MDAAAIDAELRARLGPERAGRVRWALAVLGGEADPDDPAALAEALEPTFPGRAGWPARLASFGRRRLGAFRTEGVTLGPDGVVELALVSTGGHSFRWWLDLGIAPPHRLRGAGFVRSLPEGAIVREADERDLEALIAIEQETGIEREDGTRITTCRGARFFDWVQLVVGLQCSASQDAQS
jgi:hypothetical protein